MDSPGCISILLGFLPLMVFAWVFFVSSAVAVVGTVLWVWMLIDCAQYEPNEGNDRVVWILIIALTHLIGALVYLFVRRPQRQRELGR